MTNQIKLQIWAENVKTKASWQVKEKRIGESEYCSKRSISQFLAEYLTEQSAKHPLTIHNLQEKVEELAIISEVGEEDALEAEFAGVRYFIRYGNFEF